MNELVIKTHDFEMAKKRLKEFSEKNVCELEIDTVKTEGGFLGLGDHKVTGCELNSRLSIIQQYLIELNITNNKTIKEFGQVYSTFEALDKDYIQAILTSIKSTEKTSECIQETQEKMKRIVDDQKKTLEHLKKFKQKLDGYAHLGDIDKIWSDCHKWYNEITTLSNSISSLMDTSKANAKQTEDLKTVLKAMETKLNDLSKQLNQQIAKFGAIVTFTNELEKIIHLQDIDAMWDSLSNLHNSLTNISNELSCFEDIVSKQKSDVETVLSFMRNLTDVNHLKDVDDIWMKSELNSSKLFELERRSDETKNFLKMTKESVDVAIASVIENNDTAVQMLTKKIKYAYLLASGTLGLAIIEMIVILFKVI